MARRELALVFVVGATGCGEPPPPAPSAVLDVSPSSVCLGDDYKTSIVLDASGSAPRLTLVPVAPDPDEPPLGFAFHLSGSAYRLLSGDLASATLTLGIAADRPLHVELTVRNAGGGEASVQRSIAVTVCAP